MCSALSSATKQLDLWFHGQGWEQLQQLSVKRQQWAIKRLGQHHKFGVVAGAAPANGDGEHPLPVDAVLAIAWFACKRSARTCFSSTWRNSERQSGGTRQSGSRRSCSATSRLDGVGSINAATTLVSTTTVNGCLAPSRPPDRPRGSGHLGAGLATLPPLAARFRFRC